MHVLRRIALVLRRCLRWASLGVYWLAALAFIAWSALAIWFDASVPDPMRSILTLLALVAGPVMAFAARSNTRGRWLVWLPPAAVLVWWLTLAPRADRDWLPDVARVASASIDGDTLTVRNVRAFRYRSEQDFDPIWETREYDLSQIVGFDLYLSYWGPTLYAHTISSWEFADGRHLAISIETRKEKGEIYSALGGFFRQYELHYVVADERDVVGVRAAHRGERVYLYRLRSSPEAARRGLLSFMDRLNRLAARPAWYNALLTNCTTTIWHHVKHVAPEAPWDWRVLANGYLDELAYSRGAIDRSLPFDALRARSEISERAARAIGSETFSARIREDLPPRPPPRDQPGSRT